MKTYTEGEAYRRQGYLSREFGIFPGVIRSGDRWRLTYDPEPWEMAGYDTTAELPPAQETAAQTAAAFQVPRHVQFVR